LRYSEVGIRHFLLNPFLGVINSRTGSACNVSLHLQFDNLRFEKQPSVDNSELEGLSYLCEVSGVQSRQSASM